MELQCLLLGDSHVREVVCTALEQAHVTVKVATDSAVARDLLAHGHFHGFVIDCDDVASGAEMLPQIRSGGSSSRSPIIAVVNGKTSIQTALDSGANFVLAKPISQERLDQYVRLALVFLNHEFRRYYRHKVLLPVTVAVADKEVEATIVDVSLGGIAIKVFGGDKIEGTVGLRFKPSNGIGSIIDAQGLVVWRNEVGKAGLQLLCMDAKCNEVFQKWLHRLEAQGEGI